MTSGTWRRNAASSKQPSSWASDSALGHGRIDRQQVAHRGALVGGAQGRSLDDRVGVVARHAADVDQGDQDIRGGVQAEAPFDVLAHPL